MPSIKLDNGTTAEELEAAFAEENGTAPAPAPTPAPKPAPTPVVAKEEPVAPKSKSTPKTSE